MMTMMMKPPPSRARTSGALLERRGGGGGIPGPKPGWPGMPPGMPPGGPGGMPPGPAGGQGWPDGGVQPGGGGGLLMQHVPSRRTSRNTSLVWRIGQAMWSNGLDVHLCRTDPPSVELRRTPRNTGQSMIRGGVRG
ncbi:hypothetical protein DPM19_10985 [Actinomadura craniellae]|uniref:Uncharacterized protein n=1 Tax=Actinomadura craniellae TaxID=2231787 RepID=A0A365H7Y6_9ACTN|nr:hypothetical protein DPM19_10985 [Actinomadura craniellae]